MAWPRFAEYSSQRRKKKPVSFSNPFRADRCFHEKIVKIAAKTTFRQI
jgi:hypothetical protein